MFKKSKTQNFTRIYCNKRFAKLLKTFGKIIVKYISC